MPRRARPLSRAPPTSKTPASLGASPIRQSVSPRSSWNPQRTRPTRLKAVDFFSEPERDGVGHHNANEGQVARADTSGGEDDELTESASSEDPGSSEGGSESSGSEGEEEDVADADAPRISQWVDDEMIDDCVSGGESDWEGTHSTKPDVQMRSLQDDLSAFPLGVLRKAQYSLGQARALSDSDSASTSESEESDVDNSKPFLGTSKETSEGKPDPQRQKKELAKRPHKHAPTEVSSKRPVSRCRMVVEDNTPKPRDPRFLQVTGKYNQEKFRQQYSFLSELHTNELQTLRENYKTARKLLANSPHDLRPAREEEVKRLELAVKRAESAVNRDTRERVEVEALQKVAQAEKHKRKEGKGAWFMKRSEKKDLLNKARYDAIAASGGSQAVKKAIEKKRKKISQKEKKSRPFANGAFGQGAADSNTRGRKRSAGSAGDTYNKGAKRRRVS
ncbi:hypothetical protein EDC04DRAFT_2686221 [Pisolithus marmoratus]|nr:hypothetical protein EDC04DRAFT_2686221 [Pisolithus marmoratus]